MQRQGKNKRAGPASGRRDDSARDGFAQRRLHPLINAKLKPPQVPSLWIERKALLLQLNKALNKKLVLLAAPIGSGKTTLLTQWHRQLVSLRAIGWLSLDEQDNDPVAFFSYLIGAVRSAVGDFGAYIANRLHEHVDLPLDHVGAVFVESLNTIERDIVIVLDDFQCITDPAILRALLFLVQRSGPHVHWLISARGSPQLNLSQLTLQDDIALLGEADLRFDATQIAQMSRKLCRAGISSEDADYIRARTEGWVAGVKLALLSAANPQNGRESLKQFAGSHSEVVRYLANTVLHDQPPLVRDFLVTSAVVDKMNADLCNALLGISNSQALLEGLERAQLFVHPLDSHRQWYRYHVLFLDFLRSCLRRDLADRVPGLHKTASQWFAEHQMYEEALAHAFAASDRAWALEMVARCARDWLNQGEIADVLRWTERLTHEEILGHRGIAIPHIAALILSRRFNDAAELLHAAETRAARRTGANRARPSELEVLRLMLAILSDVTDSTYVIHDDALQRTNDVFLAATLMIVQAYRLLREQRFDGARRMAMRARDTLRGTNSAYIDGYTDVVVSLADRAQGNFKAAAASCEQAYARVKGGRRNPAWVNAATALAHVRYEQNRLAEAEALCVELLPLLSIASTVENLAIAYITFARIKSIGGKYGEAFQLLDYLHSVLESGMHRRFLAQVCYEKIRLYLMQRQDDRARAIGRDFDLPRLYASGEWQHAREYDQVWERLGFAQAMLLLKERRFGDCLALLNLLRDSARSTGYVYREVPLQAAIAACHWRSGEQDAAFAALNQGFALSPQSGFSRSVFDEVPSLQAVIAAAMTTKKLGYLLPTKYFKKFQDVFAGGQEVSPLTNRKLALPLEPLTDREFDMLKLLAQGLSNQEISERSRIASSTVRWHLKNVFAKLDVSSRTGAIVRAKELQLIDV